MQKYFSEIHLCIVWRCNLITAQKTMQNKMQSRSKHAFTASLLAAVIAFTSCATADAHKAQAPKQVTAVKKAAKAKQYKRKNAVNSKGASVTGHGYASHETLASSLKLASVGGLGRRLPQGLQLASSNVQVGCLKPELVSMLKTIQQQFGKPVIITSGYRSPAHNHKIQGAKGSLHMSCSAADIKVVGVNKWEVAKFVRSMPNRGGVGTYCHQAIHVDVGRKRDWHWGCSGKH